MTTRITSGGPPTYVAAVPTAPRTTAAPARPFQQVISASASAIVQSAEQAATHLPGGPILAAAMRSPLRGTAVSGAQSPEGATSALGTGPSLGGAGAPLGSSGGAPGIEGVLSQGVDQNMYFLELQERISQESRTYSALSNVLKARHETVKNAIGNIR
jgi:hypothetical protein